MKPRTGSPSNPANKSLLGIFAAPIALAALTIFGLLAALLGEGRLWRALSWIALILPIGVVLWCVLRPAQKRWRRAPERGSKLGP